MSETQKPKPKTYKREIAALAMVVWLGSYLWVIGFASRMEQATLALLTTFVSTISIPIFALVGSMFGLDSYNKQTRQDKNEGENG